MGHITIQSDTLKTDLISKLRNDDDFFYQVFDILITNDTYKNTIESEAESVFKFGELENCPRNFGDFIPWYFREELDEFFGEFPTAMVDIVYALLTSE